LCRVVTYRFNNWGEDKLFLEKYYNKVLSEKRANAVARYLEQKGLRIESIEIEGKGEIKDGRDRRWNRRVEVLTKF
jgi:outer membrane protein OmpA-like peptidoglycan-associated protein